MSAPSPRPASSARAAVQRLARAFDRATPEDASGVVHFPYTHLVDFRGATSVKVYDQARFEEALRERAEHHLPTRRRRTLTTQTLSATAAIVRERIELPASTTRPRGRKRSLQAAHVVARSAEGWLVVSSWFSAAPE